MRMQLFEAIIEHPKGSTPVKIVAPSEGRAVELVMEHYEQIDADFFRVKINRIDDELEDEDRRGLDDMLENAPVCFASFCLPWPGWVAHAATVHRLRLFRIEELDAGSTFVLAPNPDIAAAIWASTLEPSEGDPALFRTFDAERELTAEQRGALDTILEYGPVGIVEWQEDRWVVR